MYNSVCARVGMSIGRIWCGSSPPQHTPDPPISNPWRTYNLHTGQATTDCVTHWIQGHIDGFLTANFLLKSSGSPKLCCVIFPAFLLLLYPVYGEFKKKDVCIWYRQQPTTHARIQEKEVCRRRKTSPIINRILNNPTKKSKLKQGKDMRILKPIFVDDLPLLIVWEVLF